METIMQKVSNFRLNDEEMSALVTQGMHVLESSGTNYNPHGYALRTLFNAWVSEKGWMVDLFKKSPNYVEGKYMIKLNEVDLQRPANKEGIRQFVRWAKDELENMFRKYQFTFGFFTVEEYNEMIRGTYYNMLFARDSESKTYKGHTYEYWKEDYNRIKANKMRAIDHISCISDYWVDDTVFHRYMHIRDIFNMLDDANNNDIDDRFIDAINTDIQAANMKSKVCKGSKWTKYIGKLCRELGLDKIVDIQTETYHANGETITRQADKGYNYHRALLGDSINPLNYKATLILSCNPIDYWTMSWGASWASCHDICKNGGRRGHNYEGIYSGGTEGYMLDDATFIVYTLMDDEWYETHRETHLPDEEKSKRQRCVFILGEDKLIENRVYPDDRDGGDAGLNAQFRNIVQKVIADLYETPNYWELRKGASACNEAVETVYAEGQDWSFHYADYVEYENGSVSYLRRINGNINTRKIQVGSEEIVCPSCGSWHSDSHEYITCDSCSDTCRCSYCNDPISDTDNAIYAADGDDIFCCECCAERAGYVWCEDTEDWRHEDNCCQDSRNGDWYYYTEDGVYAGDNWYHSVESAESDGWRYCDYDNEWEREWDTLEVGDTGEYFSTNIHDSYIETEDGWYFPDEAVAESYGYHETSDGSWTDEEEETEEAV